MAHYRAVRTEGRVAVGEWTGDFFKGDVVETGTGPGQVPPEVASYLHESGFFIPVEADAVSNPWFDSDDPELRGES